MLRIRTLKIHFRTTFLRKFKNLRSFLKCNRFWSIGRPKTPQGSSFTDWNFGSQADGELTIILYAYTYTCIIQSCRHNYVREAAKKWGVFGRTIKA